VDLSKTLQQGLLGRVFRVVYVRQHAEAHAEQPAVMPSYEHCVRRFVAGPAGTNHVFICSIVQSELLNLLPQSRRTIRPAFQKNPR
jgi:hypothetical protein